MFLSETEKSSSNTRNKSHVIRTRTFLQALYGKRLVLLKTHYQHAKSPHWHHTFSTALVERIWLPFCCWLVPLFLCSTSLVIWRRIIMKWTCLTLFFTALFTKSTSMQEILWVTCFKRIFWGHHWFGLELPDVFEILNDYLFFQLYQRSMPCLREPATVARQLALFQSQMCHEPTLQWCQLLLWNAPLGKIPVLNHMPHQTQRLRQS